ncbi:Protein-S-isoprenylcysteine O-methyltransferase Ste14 [Chitinophaga costaii]|uniref:Protein-S-isoprenylcysteine O-methyltransferase Ste14 n=1 Tax=Chitinophaga costaii TaxID=1335309 RepID=A0A1C4AH05_9BACT|nr:isoprenylcysteine carboxylmethyltransferase family protein [Chitinophaga costaii]PUZ26599.1 isoprenylcysteine carboxylmethyltransferase family protein [Chitinophaga costaii]SCB93865.1 Protein-S-isoprenylcysteine O-methyltransferase Ste14 [Chitinophaga costaii]
MYATGIVSLIFCCSELLLSFLKRSNKQTSRTRNDKGSLALFWIFIPIVVSVASVLRRYLRVGALPHKPCFIIGLLLAISGLLLRWIAIYQLGSLFTVDVAITEHHALKTDGLYSVVRHPSYTGLLMIMTGLALTMSNWICLLLIVIPFLLLLGYRIQVEEAILKTAFPDAYTAYQRRTKRLLPGIY